MIPIRRRGLRAAGIALLTTAFLIALPAVALADEHAPVGVSDETQFILNTFAFVASLIVWKAMDLVMGLRVSPEVERLGQDTGELGIETYPEFVLPRDWFYRSSIWAVIGGTVYHHQRFGEDSNPGV